ncbi:hypothetical protein EV182_001748, partial [Spiromyces aspiralis]
RHSDAKGRDGDHDDDHAEAQTTDSKLVEAIAKALVKDVLYAKSGYCRLTQPQSKLSLGLGWFKRSAVNIYYEIYGTGPKKLLFIMGMGGTRRYWQFQISHFASLAEYQVCVYDNRGSGRSPAASGAILSITQMAHDALGLLDYLGWSENVHIVGVSMGGMIAQKMCLVTRDDRAPHGATSKPSSVHNSEGGKQATGGPHPPFMPASASAPPMQGNDGTGWHPPPRFASVTFVDTWHTASLALPTAKEVKFFFNITSALRRDPGPIMGILFPKNWANEPFDESQVLVHANEDLQRFRGKNRSSKLVTKGQVIRAICRHFDHYDLDISPSLQETENTTLGQTGQNVPARMPRVSTEPYWGPSHRTSNQTLEASAETEPPRQVGLLSMLALPVDRHTSNCHSMSEGLLDAALPERASSRYDRSNNDGGSNGTNGVSKHRANKMSDIDQFFACIRHHLDAKDVRSIPRRHPRTKFLVIHGRKDRVIRPICGKLLSRLLRCPLVWIENAGHMPLLDAPQSFNAVIKAWTGDEPWLACASDHTWIRAAQVMHPETAVPMGIVGREGSNSDFGDNSSSISQSRTQMEPSTTIHPSTATDEPVPLSKQRNTTFSTFTSVFSSSSNVSRYQEWTDRSMGLSLDKDIKIRLYHTMHPRTLTRSTLSSPTDQPARTRSSKLSFRFPFRIRSSNVSLNKRPTSVPKS